MIKTKSQVSVAKVNRVDGKKTEKKDDLLAVEEPLQIRLQYVQNAKWDEQSLTVTMRTPGTDYELTIGFLFVENVIQKRHDISHIRHCHNVDKNKQNNVIIVKLASHVSFDFGQLNRNFITNSSCGVCGKSAIDSIMWNEEILPVKKSQRITIETILQLNQIMEKQQTIFRYTGGLHATALFNFEGDCLFLREDVGRHNALDKVIGAALVSELIPLDNFLIFLSGRVSFELVQKAVRAGIPIIVAVGAPSSLAVNLANAKGCTLIGFLRGEHFNVYTHHERIKDL